MVMDQINGFESPFKWAIPPQNAQQSEWMVRKPREKLNCVVDDPGFKWLRYTNLLVLIYEHSCREETEVADQCLKECEVILSDPQNLADQFYLSIEKSLWHVLLATKLRLMPQDQLAGDWGQSIISQITPFSEMTDEQKAGVLGIRTSVVMCYGPEIGGRELGTIREAILLSPNQAEWYHIEGRLLKRTRSASEPFSCDTDPIFEAFKTAFELNSENASYVLKYALQLKLRAYPIKASTPEFRTRWQEVIQVYDKALALRPDCPYNLITIAKGFARLPIQFRDLGKSLDLLLRAQERAPRNHNILHEIGKLYEGHRDNIETACQYYEQAFTEGSYGAAYSYIKAKLKITNNEFDPIPTLERVRSFFFEKERQAESVIQMGCYHLFMHLDLDSALDNFSDALTNYPASNFFRNFKPSYLHLYEPRSLLELLHNHIRSEDRTNLSSEQIDKRDAVLEQVYGIDPELREKPVNRYYWSDIWAEHEQKKAQYMINQGRRRNMFEHQVTNRNTLENWHNNVDNGRERDEAPNVRRIAGQERNGQRNWRDNRERHPQYNNRQRQEDRPRHEDGNPGHWRNEEHNPPAYRNRDDGWRAQGQNQNRNRPHDVRRN